MTAQIIDGRRIADSLLTQIANRIQTMTRDHVQPPGLAVILVGQDPASQVYVRNKRRTCAEVGIRSHSYDLPPDTPEPELLAIIDRLNADPDVHGILVQLPLPPHIDTERVIERIEPMKDVDGFHPYNLGRLAIRYPTLRPCTPLGVMTLLASIRQELKGKNAVVIGASNHVGRPMALELLLADCTVTICHKLTRDLPAALKTAEVVIAAAGCPGLVRGEWIMPGATVIDIGINRLPDGRLTGDVDYASALTRAAWITPVPGGVGPMTVAALMENTLTARELQEAARRT